MINYNTGLRTESSTHECWREMINGDIKMPCARTSDFEVNAQVLKGNVREAGADGARDLGVLSESFISDEYYKKITTQAGSKDAGCLSRLRLGERVKIQLEIGS